MRSIHLSVLAAAAAAAIASSEVTTSAAPATSFSSSLVTELNAIGDDFNLTGRIQNLMTVNVGMADWTNSSIRIELDTGTVYNATNAVGTESTPVPAFWTSGGFRNGPYDTFVNSKGTGSPNPDTAPTAATILGTLNADRTSGPAPAVGLSTNDATFVSVQWGNLVGGETGTFSVARFTLSADASGTFIGQTFDANNAFTDFGGEIVAGVMVIPEPASLSLLGVASAGLLLARRRGRNPG